MCHQGLETENDDSVKNFEEESLYSEELEHCDDLSQSQSDDVEGPRELGLQLPLLSGNAGRDSSIREEHQNQTEKRPCTDSENAVLM